MRAAALLTLALVVPFTTAEAATAPDPGRSTTTLASAPRAASGGGDAAVARKPVPRLRVRTVVDGLEIPWDVQALPTGELLITERNRRRLHVWDGTRLRKVRIPRRTIAAFGETGLMSMAVDANFAKNRRLHVCHGHRSGDRRDVRVVTWKLKRSAWKVTKRTTLLKGLPTGRDGRHGGCRLLLARNGALLVGTGDGTVGANPQRLTSLGGKVLRLDPRTGKPWRSNPWRKAKNRKKRYVFTYGHRNVQGLAQRRDGRLWSVEHGSYRNDEVNLLRKRGNYGWNPVPGYNESVPMTDHSLPGKQRNARWRSGSSTIATSGAAWVQGKRWKRFNNTLAVAALAGQRLVFMKFDKRGRLKWAKAPAILRKHGRLRSVTRSAGGDLLVTTSNGAGDKVLRISPR